MMLSFSYENNFNKPFLSPFNAILPWVFDNGNETVSDFLTDDDEGDELNMFAAPNVTADQNCNKTRAQHAASVDEYNNEVLVPESPLIQENQNSKNGSLGLSSIQYEHLENPNEYLNGNLCQHQI